MSETPTPSLLQDWLREKARVPYFAAYRGDLLSIAHALDSLHSALTAERAAREELDRTVRVLSRVQTELIAERNTLRAELKQRAKQIGVACMRHDLTHALACGHCFAEAEDARKRAEAERDALLRFKQFVHGYLTQRGVPEDPPGKHRDEGCRVGQRLQHVCDERDALAEAWREYLSAEQIIEQAAFGDNYTDAARARARQQRAIGQVRAALAALERGDGKERS